MIWGDVYVDAIEASNLDGTSRMILLTETNVQYFALVLHGKSIYFTDWHSQYDYFICFRGDELLLL